jgi:hypothetical protein
MGIFYLTPLNILTGNYPFIFSLKILEHLNDTTLLTHRFAPNLIGVYSLGQQIVNINKKGGSPL